MAERWRILSNLDQIMADAKYTWTKLDWLLINSRERFVCSWQIQRFSVLEVTFQEKRADIRCYWIQAGLFSGRISILHNKNWKFSSYSFASGFSRYSCCLFGGTIKHSLCLLNTISVTRSSQNPSNVFFQGVLNFFETNQTNERIQQHAEILIVIQIINT